MLLQFELSIVNVSNNAQKQHHFSSLIHALPVLWAFGLRSAHPLGSAAPRRGSACSAYVVNTKKKRGAINEVGVHAGLLTGRTVMLLLRVTCNQTDVTRFTFSYTVSRPKRRHWLPVRTMLSYGQIYFWRVGSGVINSVCKSFLTFVGTARLTAFYHCYIKTCTALSMLADCP